ncbi:MAG: hypothetical protein D6762_08970 [Candidatus Neomarinimicrobiota bacterium]|nr:MAG: hypothetical protein D6762_08970 [Candidatus Neomarinimicrobiota bacterium]
MTVLPRSSMREGVLPFLLGVYFGLLQNSAYFLFQCYVTATFLGYFFLTVAWLGGIWFQLQWPRPLSLSRSLGLSAGAYGLYYILLRLIPPATPAFPVYAFLVFLMAQPAGALFRTRCNTWDTATLFFRENNGFVLGLVLGLLGFIHWGVRAPVWLPLGAGLSLLALRLYGKPGAVLAAALGFAGLLAALFRGQSTWIDLVVTAGLILTGTGLSRPPVAPARRGAVSPAPAGLSSRRRQWILILAGMNLLVLQFFVTREFSVLLSATEVAVVLVATTYFIGFSVGYFFAPRFTETQVIRLTWIVFFLHLDVFLLIRFLAAFTIYLGAGWWVLVGLLFLTAFLTSAYYALFLPRFTEIGSADLALTTTYSRELIGGILGVLLLSILTYARAPWLLPAYFLIFLLLILCLRPRLWKSALVVGLGVLPFLILRGPAWKEAVTRDYYAFRGYSHPTLCFQRYSFYHTLDIIDTHPVPGSPPDGRWSFINGVLYFGYAFDAAGEFDTGTGLSEFTYFLAELPARYLHQLRRDSLDILILGCGSMYSVGRVSPLARRVDLVEIDGEVVRSARTCWSALNRYGDWPQAHIIIDDAKHFVRTTEQTYDLIVIDISAPYTLGTLLLHNQDFFHLLKRRLKPGGLLAESTQGAAQSNEPGSQGMRILGGVRAEYPHTLVLNTTGGPFGHHGFVYATLDDPPDTSLFASLLADNPDRQYIRLEKNWDRTVDWSQVRPFTYHNMESLLTGNVWRLTDRLNLDRNPWDPDWWKRRWIKALDLRLQTPHQLRLLFTSPWFWMWLVAAGLALGVDRSRDTRRQRE